MTKSHAVTAPRVRISLAVLTAIGAILASPLALAQAAPAAGCPKRQR